MAKKVFDIIVIGSGSGGLSVGLFMAKAGFSTLMVSKSDKDIGGDCLNDGCVPSKAFIHVAKTIAQTRDAARFGLNIGGSTDIKKVTAYIKERQSNIREHENAAWLRDQGVDVALGKAHFSGKNEVTVGDEIFTAKKIVIATGSQPRKMHVRGIENIKWFDNESIFDIEELPERLLVVGGGPIGIEIAQAMSRLGSRVTIVHRKSTILEHDDEAVSTVLYEQLENEGIRFIMSSEVEAFPSPNEAVIKKENGATQVEPFDAVFIGIGRELNLSTLGLENAGIEIKNGNIVSNKYLQTTNKDVFVCGDIAGDLKFSHAAEFHARIILNNLFSPFNQKLDNRHMSWVTFTDPEVATFGYSENDLKNKGIGYIRLASDFAEDDRAVVDSYQYARTVLFISKSGFLRKQKILGGSMVAPNAGELIQELILANTQGLSINAIFNKIYPYPVAARINQKLIVDYKSKGLTGTIKKLLQLAFKLFS